MCVFQPRLHGKVAISHAFVLGDGGGVSSSELADLDAALAEAGVAIMTTGALGLGSIQRLTSAGVRVFFGNDNCYDFWCGVDGQAGDLRQLGLHDNESANAAPDMLRRAAAVGAAQRSDESVATELLRLATVAVGEVTGLGGGQLSPGARADFVLVAAGSLVEALTGFDQPRAVFRAGQRLLFAPASAL